MSLHPRKAQMREYMRNGAVASETLNLTLQALVQALVDGSDLATASDTLNLHPSSVERYLGPSPWKSDIVACQMMIRRYYQREGPVIATLGALTATATGTVT